MSRQPFERVNRAHRELIDTPWSRPPERHRVREQWRERQRPIHLDARQFMRPSLVERWARPITWIGIIAALVAFGLIVGRWLLIMLLWEFQ